MEIILILCLLLGIIFILPILTLGLDLKNRFWKKTIDKALEHDDLIILVNNFCNSTEKTGICFGFTLTWVLAVLMHNELLFYRRLDLIRKQGENLIDEVENINQKIRKKKTITEEEYRIAELRPFSQSIRFAQDPEKFEEFYAEHINQVNVNQILRLIANTPANAIFTKTVTFSSKQQTRDYFRQLHQLLRTNHSIAMKLSDERHSIGLKRYRKVWLCIDINTLYKQSSNYPYFILGDRKLSRLLYKNFEENNQLIFTTHFFTNNHSQALKKQLQSLDSLYPVLPEHLTYCNARKISFLNVCLVNGDEASALRILKLDKQFNLLHKKHIKIAVHQSIFLNQQTILAKLLKKKGFDINTPCSPSGLTTPLGIACKGGYLHLVQFLLSRSGILINVVNNYGDTPLMKACKSRHTKENKELFRVLLRAGASLKPRNAKGKNALSIAKSENNQSAIHVINKFRRTKKISNTANPKIAQPTGRTSAKKIASQGTSLKYSMFAPKKEWNIDGNKGSVLGTFSLVGS